MVTSIKSGYKQTAVGIIPKDWDVVRLGDLKPFITSGSRGWANYYANSGDFFVRITNLTRKSIYLDLTDCKYVNLPDDNGESIRTQLQENDVLISITADIGIIGYVNANVPFPAYINQHIALVRFDPKKANGKFISYFLSSEAAQLVFHATTDIGAKAGMNLDGVQKILTALPPNTVEQTAIAAALSDTDGYISTLEKLIAKKKAVKQGAMQELLTGKRLLPGCSGEWKEKILREVLKVGHGKRQNEIEIEGGRYPILATGGVIGHTNTFLYDKPSVLIGRKGTIDKPQYMDTPFWTIDTLFYTIINDDTNPKYLYYLFCTIDWGRLNEASGVPSLSASVIEKLQVVLPDEAEQTAIAAVLSDMDAEIDALTAKLNKAKHIKQGMMSELLTGRIRLGTGVNPQ